MKEDRNKQKMTTNLGKTHKRGYCFEIDFEYFEAHYWPTIQKQYYHNKHITAHLVWTEIYSTIKGSAYSHQYPQYRSLPKNNYILGSSNIFLTQEDKEKIYQAFKDYEYWKSRIGGYDMLDVVNYILFRFYMYGYSGPELHYVMID